MRWLANVRRNPFVLPMAVVAGLAIFFISEGSYWRSQDSISDLYGVFNSRQSLITLERVLVDAEIGQLGYLLTGRTDYLQTHQDGRSLGLEALAVLDVQSQDDPAAQVQLTELRQLWLAKLDELDKTIVLMRTDQKGAAMDLMMAGAGQQNLDRVRRLTAKLMSEQRDLRELVNRELERTLLLGRYGVAALSCVLMLALVLYLRKSADLVDAQEIQQVALQEAHIKLEADVLLRTEQLTDLTRYLLRAREDERHRLARNLHDDLGSLLTAAKLDAARLRSRLGPNVAETQALLAGLVTKLNSSILLGRSIIEDLRPSTLDHMGLPATLELLAADFAQRLGVEVHSNFESVRLLPSTELVVFRVVQEALTNISKYARASQVWIDLGLCPDSTAMVCLRVRDDGVGFDARAPSRSVFGLMGMRFRVEAEGGTLSVQSEPGQGTWIEVLLPVLSTPS